ncbi:MAG: hypothetical protein WCJ64_17165 [Rhodospirillaceae bacterium]
MGYFASALALFLFLNAGLVGGPSTPQPGVASQSSAAPVVSVKVLSTPDKTPDEIKSQEQHEGNELWLTRWTFWLFVATSLLAVIAFGQLYVFYKQLRIMSINIKDTQTASDAAKTSAIALKESSDTARISMITGNRAYLGYATSGHTSHVDVSDGSIFWKVNLLFHNSGNTPAHSCVLSIGCDLREAPLPGNFNFSSGLVDLPPSTVSPKSGFGWTYRITGEDLKGVMERKKFLYIYGTIKYEVVFKELGPRHTNFSLFVAEVMGDPTKYYDKDSNIVEIVLANYEKHNSAT